MKSAINFINKSIEGQRKVTLRDKIEEYKSIEERLVELNNLREIYEASDPTIKKYKQELTFEEQKAIHNMIKNAINNDENPSNSVNYNGINLYILKMKIEFMYEPLHDYLSIIDEIVNLENKKRNIIFHDLSFWNFDRKPYNIHCMEGHCFVVEDNVLKCVYCGASTQDYSLTKEEFEFLVMAVNKRRMLLKDYTEEDWPIIESIIKKQDERRKNREELDEDDEDYLAKAEKQYYEDASEKEELRSELNYAHMKKTYQLLHEDNKSKR